MGRQPPHRGDAVPESRALVWPARLFKHGVRR